MSRYYRAVKEYIGDVVVFKPLGKYPERVHKNGKELSVDEQLVKVRGKFEQKKVGETAASKTISGAIFGAYSMLAHDKKYADSERKISIYAIEDKPDVDMSWWKKNDFSLLQEVRYRRPVKGIFLGEYVYTDEDVKKFNAYLNQLSKLGSSGVMRTVPIRFRQYFMTKFNKSVCLQHNRKRKRNIHSVGVVV